ncbi:MAG: hypothetical protein UF067_01270 [Paludibacteraceae bacterium]|nr:hypothetical protein [Paludibacteraceae bacterium]
MKKMIKNIVACVVAAFAFLSCGGNEEEDLHEDIRKKRLETIEYAADDVEVCLYLCKGPVSKKGSSFYVYSKTQLDSVLRIFQNPNLGSGDVKIDMPYDAKFFKNNCLLMCFDELLCADDSACKVTHAFESGGTVYAMTNTGACLVPDGEVAEAASYLGVVELPRKGLSGKSLNLIDDRSVFVDYEVFDAVFSQDSELKMELAEFLGVDDEGSAKQTAAEFFEKYRLYCAESVMSIGESNLWVRGLVVDPAGTLKIAVQNVDADFKVADKYKFLEIDKDVEVKRVRFLLQR